MHKTEANTPVRCSNLKTSKHLCLSAFRECIYFCCHVHILCYKPGNNDLNDLTVTEIQLPLVTTDASKLLLANFCSVKKEKNELS